MSIYSISLGNKYLFYAPLKRIAFVGNESMKQVIERQSQDRFDSEMMGNDSLIALQRIGFFEPSQRLQPSLKTDILFAPSICILMLTTACNMSCSYCYAANGTKAPTVMNWETAKKGIDIAYKNSVERGLCFSLSFHGGGEPTLPQELILRACQYARSLDSTCPISITSNCVWDETFRDKLLSYVNEISVSFDGARDTQDKQRPLKDGRGSFQRVVESIHEIEKRKISYGIRMTVTQKSLPMLLENVKFIVDKTNCKSIHVEAVYSQGKANGSSQCISDPNDFIERFLEAYDFAKTQGIFLKVSSVRLDSLSTSFCRATSEALIVTSDGHLSSCYEVFDESHPLAKEFLIGELNIADGALLYPQVRTRLLEQIESNRLECEKCFCYYHCAGDCPPKSILARRNGDNFRCLVTQGITKALLVDKVIEGNGIWNGNKGLEVSLQELSTK